jgi:hypothetical protein
VIPDASPGDDIVTIVSPETQGVEVQIGKHHDHIKFLQRCFCFTAILYIIFKKSQLLILIYLKLISIFP